MSDTASEKKKPEEKKRAESNSNCTCKSFLVIMDLSSQMSVRLLSVYTPL